MTREDRTILRFSHIILDPGKQRALREAVSADLDWQYILKVCQEEQICCLAYHHLKSLDLEQCVPNVIRESFRSIYYEVCARNTLIMSRARNLLQILQEERLPVILLKGIFLANYVYPGIGCRPMVDIDILVQEKDRSRLGDILGEFGYSFIGKGRTDKNPFEYAWTFEAADKTRQPLTVDVHFNLLTASWLMGLCRRKVDLERIWSKAMPLQFDGIDSRGLSPEHLLIFLSCHSFTHDHQRLIRLVDIEGVLQAFKGKLDLEEAQNEAKRFGLDNILKETLERVEKLAKGNDRAAGLLKERYPGISSIRYVVTRPGLFERIRALIRLVRVFLRIRSG